MMASLKLDLLKTSQIKVAPCATVDAEKYELELDTTVASKFKD